MATQVEAVKASKNILFFGATGTIGKPILSVVTANRSVFDRLVVFTSPGGNAEKKEYLANLKGKGVEIIEGDMTNEEQVLKAYNGIDTIVCTLGRGAIALQIPLIQLADRTPHIHRFIPSEFGTDIEYSPASINEPPHQQKIKVRAAMAETKTLDYTYVVTGPYADMYMDAIPRDEQLGTFDVAQKKAVVQGDGKGEVSLTTEKDVGKLLLLVLTHPIESSKRALKVRSFTTTPLAIVHEFEKQTGDKWSVITIPLDKFRELEKAAYEEKKPTATVYTLRRIWAEGGTLYDKYDNEDIGARPHDMETLEDAVKLAIEVQAKGAAN